MKHSSRIAALLAVISLASVAQGGTPTFRYEAIPEFGFPMSRANDVLPNGHINVVGEVNAGQVWRPVVWSRNADWTFVELPVPSAEGDAFAFGVEQIPAGGLFVVGEVWVDARFPFPYLWKEENPGNFMMVELPNAGEGGANGIAVGTELVVIAGWSEPGGEPAARKDHRDASVWIGRFTEPLIREPLPAYGGERPSIAYDASFFGEMPVAVGQATNDGDFLVPILWTCDKGEWLLRELPLLPGGLRGVAHGVSRPNGQHKIVGSCEDATGLTLPVRWVSDDGFDWEIQQFEPLGIIGDVHDVASSDGLDYHVGRSLNDDSIGTLWITNGVFEVFDLNEVIMDGPPPMMLQTAHGVAANGHIYIVGEGTVSGAASRGQGTETHAYLLEEDVVTSVPSAPSTIMPSVDARPNPAGQQLSFGISLPIGGEVTLTVHDPNGRLVATLVDEPLSAGEHLASWNAREVPGQAVATGVYFARLRVGGNIVSSRFVIRR